MAKQLQGPIVCLTKKAYLKEIDNYRPLKLTNTEYKIMIRKIANRFRPFLSVLRHPSQHCGTQGCSLFETVATVMDVISYAEITKKPFCAVSLDFRAAFENNSHTYLQEIICAHGLVNCSWSVKWDCKAGRYLKYK